MSVEETCRQPDWGPHSLHGGREKRGDGGGGFAVGLLHTAQEVLLVADDAPRPHDAQPAHHLPRAFAGMIQDGEVRAGSKTDDESTCSAAAE